VGIDSDTCDLFSSRRRAIGGQLDELVAAYTAYTETHGKEPSEYVKTVMAEHAALKTRKRNLDYPPTRAELLAEWEQRASRELGQSLERVLADVDAERQSHAGGVRRPRACGAVRSEGCNHPRMAEVDRSKTVWTRHDLVGQLDRYLPDDVRGKAPSPPPPTRSPSASTGAPMHQSSARPTYPTTPRCPGGTTAHCATRSANPLPRTCYVEIHVRTRE
jgi:hypothetical protein